MIEVQKNTIGTCTWTLIDGVLTVESDNNINGVLKSFTDTGFRCDRPFNVDDVKCVVIKPGVSAANDISDLFRDFSLCERMDLTGLDVSNTENMRGLFRGCNALKDIDVSTWNTQNVTDMSFMFSGCRSLETLDLSSFSFDNVKDMSWMFNWCDHLKNLRMVIPDNYKSHPRMFDVCPAGPEGEEHVWANLKLFKGEQDG